MDFFVKLHHSKRTPLFISNKETGPNQQRKDIFAIYDPDKIGYLQIMTDLSTFFSKEKKSSKLISYIIILI